MAKFRAIPQGSTSQAGLVEIGHGIRSPSLGVADQAVATGQLWVDPNGSDSSGDGSFGNPFLTLTHAFAFIVSNPLTNGYSIRLPSVAWKENVGLPPPGTTIIGVGEANTSLSAPGGGTLIWTQPGGQISSLEFRDLALNANVNGVNGGTLLALFRSCIVNGTFTLVGQSDWDNCSSLPVFTNCQTIAIHNCPGNGANLSFSYDPIGGGTNGSSTPGLLVESGQWNSITYTATTTGAPLEIIGARANGITAQQSAQVRCRGTRVFGALTSNDPPSQIEYDMPQVSGTPTFSGLGQWKVAEFTLSRLVSGGGGNQNVVFPIPTLFSGAPAITDVFATTDLPGTSVSLVGNTQNTLTVFVQPGSSASYHLYLLVKP